MGIFVTVNNFGYFSTTSWGFSSSALLISGNLLTFFSANSVSSSDLSGDMGDFSTGELVRSTNGNDGRCSVESFDNNGELCCE